MWDCRCRRRNRNVIKNHRVGGTNFRLELSFGHFGIEHRIFQFLYPIHTSFNRRLIQTTFEDVEEHIGNDDKQHKQDEQLAYAPSVFGFIVSSLFPIETLFLGHGIIF